MEFIDVGDAEMAYARSGEGPPLVLVHGWPLSSATWAPILPLLEPRFTCIAVDQAGAGQARTRPDTDFNFRGQARRLNRLIDALGLGPCPVLAQDTGATVARHAALTGGQISSLALINTEIPGHRPPFIPLYQSLMALPGMKAGFRVLLRSRAYCRSPMAFGGCFTDRSLIDGAFRERTIRPLIEDPARIAGVVSYLRGIDWGIVDGLAEGHARLRIPVLLLWGEDDPTFPVGLAEEMARQIPNCRLERVQGASLLAHEEKPAEIADRALRFWREIGALGA